MNRKEIIAKLKELQEKRSRVVAEAEFFAYQNNKKKAHELWREARELKKEIKKYKRDLDTL